MSRTRARSFPLFLAPVSPREESAERRLLTARVKQLAAESGLTVSAVTSADAFPELADLLEARIRAGHMAGLDWFTADRARFSASPRNLHKTAHSLISVGIGYWTVDTGKPDDGIPRGRISRYAWGLDYHDLLKQRMRDLVRRIEDAAGQPIEARYLVDTARIVDRAAAARAGLGWYGKHACIIVPGHGSWVLLGELLLDLDLEPDVPLNRDCGRCSICLDRCPTGAIVAPYTVDAPRCLSFQTIEQRGAIPTHLRSQLGDWVYGCDICQDVCPYTSAATPTTDPAVLPRSLDNAYPSLPKLLTMTDIEFRETYRGTPVTRAKRRGLARNAAVALGNIGSAADLPLLIATLEAHDEPLVRGHAAWAIGRLAGTDGESPLRRARAQEADVTVLAEIDQALAAIRAN